MLYVDENEQADDISTPVVDMSSGTTVGFRYLQFGANPPKTVTVVLGDHKALKVNVRIDSYRGKIVASVDLDAGECIKTTEINAEVIGKHAVYFESLSEADGVIAAFDRFTFD